MHYCSCSFCREANPAAPGVEVFCWRCGHRAGVPRMFCDCPQCPPPRAEARPVSAWDRCEDHWEDR